MLCSFTELDMAVSFTCFSSFFPLSFFLLSHLPFSKQFCPISHCGPPTPSRDSIEIRFPFLNTTNPPECGLHTIKCRGSTPTVEFGPGRLYVIQSINYEDYTLVIKDDSLNHHSPSNFCDFLYNFKTPVSPFLEFKLKSPNYTFVSCKQGDHGGPLFNYSISYNHTKCGDRILYYGLGSPPPLDHQHDCSITWFPLSEEFHPNGSKKNDDLFSRLSLGFSLQWNFTEGCNECYQEKGGYCDRDPHTGKFTCPPLKYAKGKQGSSRKKSIVIGVILAVVVLIAIFLFLLIGSRYWWKKTGKASDAHNVEEFLKNYGSLALQRYTYSDLKKITYSFKGKLGQGGYGGVFKGMLLDGRLVAVKVLNESKGNGEEFINEVASIGRTYHVNVVALLGFCSEGSKRALIYEFMPNGSLEKFIYSEKPRQSLPLGWEKLCQIATGIARGLEYLHRGCNTRILHFDIKPHNILLDEGFCPKISDFGLAKLCPTQNSTISMLGARGTVGYIAPEVYCRNIGGVSYKSDVYSYGMMVLEMVGGRKNIDAFVENTSEIYFPHWIYKRLNTYKSIDLHGYLGLQGIETRIEEETARKMILVGLWCIQTNPLDRPSMSKVVEMLEGSVDGLQMPPQPFLSSSP